MHANPDADSYAHADADTCPSVARCTDHTTPTRARDKSSREHHREHLNDGTVYLVAQRCCDIFSDLDHAVLLEGIEAGFAYTVNAHDASAGVATK